MKILPAIAAALMASLSLAPAQAETVNMTMQGYFQAVPHLGFGLNPFTATLRYDLDSLGYQSISSPTFSNVHYGSQGPNGPVAGTGSLTLTSDYFSIATQHVFINFLRETPCTGALSLQCAYFQISTGQNTDSDNTRLTFWTTDLATFSSPYLPAIAPSSDTVTYAEFYVRNPNGDRIAYINRQAVDPNAPPSLIQFGPASNAVPEPATWAILIAGFGLVGAVARRRRTGLLLAAA